MPQGARNPAAPPLCGEGLDDGRDAVGGDEREARQPRAENPIRSLDTSRNPASLRMEDRP
jgi:hypothetical protein